MCIRDSLRPSRVQLLQFRLFRQVKRRTRAAPGLRLRLVTHVKLCLLYTSGTEYNFILTDCYIRIQGTSSTKYPSKNIRIYCAKGSEQLLMSGDHVSAGNKYTMRPGAVPVNLFCCKSDYSDSSMSLNTGGAKLFNDVMKELGLLTPPQQYQYEAAGSSLAAVNIRSAIDGLPIDIFCAETRCV